MSKFLTKKKIIFLSLALILLLPIVLVNLKPVKSKIFDFILNQVRSQLNADLDIKDASYGFNQFKLSLSSKLITIKQNDELVVSLSNFSLVYPLKNLFRKRKFIKSISADNLFIKAINKDNVWNLETILKPSKKKNELIFQSLSFHDTDLELVSKDHHEKEKLYLDIHKEKSKALYKIEIYNNQKLSIQDKADSDHENQFYISGDYDLKNNEGPYRYVQDLRVVLNQLEPDLINLLSRAFTDRNSRFLKFFNRYAHKETSMNILIKEDSSNSEQYDLQFDILNFPEEDSLHLDSELILAKDIVIKDLHMNFLEAKLKADGTVFDASIADPKIDFDLMLNRFNPYLFRSKFDELKDIFSKKLLRLITSVHKSLYFDPVIKVSGSFHEPNFDFQMPVSNDFTANSSGSKLFDFSLSAKKTGYRLNKLVIPLEFADLNMNGNLSQAGDIDLKLRTKDLPLRTIKPFLVESLNGDLAHQVEELSFDGYLKTDLQIKKSAKEEIPELYGDVLIAKASLLEPSTPIYMRDINTKLSIEKDLVTVESFEGALFDNTVDLNGFYNLGNQDYKLNLSAEKFDLSKIDFENLKEKFSKDVQKNFAKFSNISGIIKDLELSSSTEVKSVSSSGKLRKVSFDYQGRDQSLAFKNLNTDFSLLDNKIEIDKFSTYVNDSASLEFEGSILREFNKSQFKMKAVNLPFEALSIIDSKDIPIHPKGGLINIDSSFDRGEIEAKGNFEKLSFNMDSRKMPENFRSVNGEFLVDKDLYINGLEAFYGNSEINAEKLIIRDFLTEDKKYDIDIQSHLKIAEFKSFIPSSIAELLDLDGYLPLNLKARGDTQKFYLDVNGNFNEVSKLKFADWFDFDTKILGYFQTSFSFTPKLILSKDTYVDLTDKNSHTKIAADFEIHDWKEKKDLRYSIDAYTPLDENGNFIPVNMDLIEPHITSIEAINLNPGNGTLQCRTDGSLGARHTFCDIEFLDKAVAKNFAIGDLVSDKSSVYLISTKDKPVFIKVKLFDGIWNILDFKRVRFDMEIFGDLMEIDRIRAKLPDGFIRSNIKHNFKTLESQFKIKANNVSAHKAAESFFALGHEVPQGTVSGIFEGKTVGVLPDEMFMSLEAESGFVIRDGKLSSLKTMQKLLSAINTLKNFDFNNVFQTVITYKGGLFNDIVSQLDFDKGKITTQKLLLHSDQIEILVEGSVDYSKDHLMIRGLGAVPERSRSFLQVLGVKAFNLGNLLSIINLRNPGSKDKDYFAFKMEGPVNDMTEATQSLRQNFTWLRNYGSSD